MVDKRRIELGEKLLGEGGVCPFRFEPGDDGFLMGDVPLSLGDVSLGHHQVLARVTHGMR